MAKARSHLMLAMGCVIRGDAVLLARRNEPNIPKLHDKWELPGGKVEFGEDPASACERELLEETGVRAAVGEMLPFPFVALRRLADRSIEVAIACFECEFLSEESIELEDKISEFRWFEFEEIDPVWVQSGSLHFLNYVLRQRGVPQRQGSSRTHGICLQSFDAHRNRDREYSISIEHEIGSEQIFKVHCAWGRVRGWRAGEQRVFSDREDMLAFVDQKLRRRISHGYHLKDSTENFPDIDSFHKLIKLGAGDKRRRDSQLQLL